MSETCRANDQHSAVSPGRAGGPASAPRGVAAVSERQRATNQYSLAGARSVATELARCLGWVAA